MDVRTATFDESLVPADQETLYEALGTVIDPELGLDIVSLGLVYEAELDDDGIARILMTTTSPACPIGSYLEDQVRWAILELPGIADVEITLTHTPRWSPRRMTEDARLALGWTGA